MIHGVDLIKNKIRRAQVPRVSFVRGCAVALERGHVRVREGEGECRLVPFDVLVVASGCGYASPMRAAPRAESRSQQTKRWDRNEKFLARSRPLVSKEVAGRWRLARGAALGAGRARAGAPGSGRRARRRWRFLAPAHSLASECTPARDARAALFVAMCAESRLLCVSCVSRERVLVCAGAVGVELAAELAELDDSLLPPRCDGRRKRRVTLVGPRRVGAQYLHVANSTFGV